jgi:hypothetical protein
MTTNTSLSNYHASLPIFRSAEIHLPKGAGGLSVEMGLAVPGFNRPGFERLKIAFNTKWDRRQKSNQSSWVREAFQIQWPHLKSLSLSGFAASDPIVINSRLFPNIEYLNTGNCIGITVR